MEKIKKSKLMILTLVLIDQLVKIIINIFFKDVSFRLFNKKLGFEVYLNKDYVSVFNHDFDLNLSIGILIFIVGLPQ